MTLKEAYKAKRDKLPVTLCKTLSGDVDNQLIIDLSGKKTRAGRIIVATLVGKCPSCTITANIRDLKFTNE